MARDVRVFGGYIKRQAIALMILGAPAILPILFLSRAIIDRNSAILNNDEADVFGTGAEILLLAMLLVTPLSSVTKQRWFIPLRRWYGLMMAATAFFDAASAAITTSFAGGVVGRLAGHSFLMVGLVMVMLLIPLFLTGNNTAQRWLGRYWKPLHRLVYVVWALLAVHLALLEGFGPQNGTNGPSSGFDGTPIFHQRLYQLLAASLLPFVFRLPSVKRWVADKHKQGRQVVVYWAMLPMVLLFLIAYAYIWHEELFKGIDAFRLVNAGG